MLGQVSAACWAIQLLLLQPPLLLLLPPEGLIVEC
jgi:hypothetical protein